MINAKHYCKFVKVNGPLSPVSAPTSELQVSPRIVSAALSWRLRVTPPHVDPRDAPGRFARGASEMLGSFLQLQILLADTVATTPFMWLSEKYAKPTALRTLDSLLLQVRCIVCSC